MKNVINQLNSNLGILNTIYSSKINTTFNKIFHNELTARPSTSRKSVLNSLNNSSQLFSSQTPSSRFIIESEQLYQEKLQLINTVKKLKLKLYLLKKQNKVLRVQIKEKDNDINNIILENENNRFNQNSLIMKKIQKQTDDLKEKIDEIQKKNFFLKKNFKITRLNENDIENFCLEEQIKKMNTLISYLNKEKNKNKEKIEEYEILKEKINDQNSIINSLQEQINFFDKEEEIINKEIEEVNLKLNEEQNKMNLNKDIVISLRKKNDILKKGNYFNQYFCFFKNRISNYEEKISETKKTISIYKNKLSFQQNLIMDLEKESKTLIEQNKNKKLNLSELTYNELKSINSEKQKLLKNKTDDEEIKYLKENLEKSKYIEKELENQINIYQQKLKELIENQSERSIEDIEFGIDSNNPFYTNNEENDIIQSKKITNTQYNQFTYILFKNFEAKHITLNNPNNTLIKDLNEISKQSFPNNNDKIDINSDFFNDLILRISKKICDILNCKNENSLIKLKIYLSSLLYNSKGNIFKFIEYIRILFSYTQDYTFELEENLKKELVTQYKNSFETIINLLKKEKHEFISILDMKYLIDENIKDLNDKQIEYIFYVMKKFDDPLSDFEDLKISNLLNLININKTQSEKNEDESITEITNEEYNKHINFILSKINECLKKNNLSNLDSLLIDFIQKRKINEKTVKIITIEELNEILTKNDIQFNDIQISCLCSKFSIPDDLRIIDVEKLEEYLINKKMNKIIEFDKEKSLDFE